MGLASRGPAALHPALRRLGAAASAVTTTVDRNNAAMSWMRPGRGLLAASGARGWTADGSAAPPPPPSLVQTLRWRAQALDDTARQVPAAAAVLSRRVDGRRLATMVELEDEAVVAALDLPLAIVVGHVLDLHRRGVTVVLTLDPAGCTVVTLIG